MIHSSGALQGRPPIAAGAAGAAGLRAFVRIAELWHLSIAEQLTLLGLVFPLHLLQVAQGTAGSAIPRHARANLLHPRHL